MAGQGRDALGGGKPFLDRRGLFQSEVAGHHGRHERAGLQVGQGQGTVAQLLNEQHVALFGRLAFGGRRGELHAIARGGRKHAALERHQLNLGRDAPLVAKRLQAVVGVRDRLIDEVLGLLARVPGRAGPHCTQYDNDTH
ncbi:hypothetical protein G6F40_014142 [Rhizopus arrhizus]|nr:hypothetical protein G6F40_014142 [Rhizopus arrhizus]